MRWRILQRRTWLNLISVIILLVGLGSAVWIYQSSGHNPDEGWSFENSKMYRHDLEVYGGKFIVIMDDFRRWFLGLWQGKFLAVIIGCTTLIVAGGFFYAANYLPPPKPEAPDQTDSDGRD